MEHIIDLITQNFIEILCAGIAGAAVTYIAKTYHNLQALFTAERVNLREKLIRFGEFYILTNQITATELESYEEMFESYTALGGNGYVKELHEKVTALPVVAVRTIRNPYYVGGETVENQKETA